MYTYASVFPIIPKLPGYFKQLNLVFKIKGRYDTREHKMTQKSVCFLLIISLPMSSHERETNRNFSMPTQTPASHPCCAPRQPKPKHWLSPHTYTSCSCSVTQPRATALHTNRFPWITVSFLHADSSSPFSTFTETE